ncbi:4053_t:CDS:2 [Scutellospora calospora]|uniref:4053_t:CDS:1 n=1 Tax=Scutellospora calospora TaxID=85575 RepID=A0ACA9LQK8_9GLOM|nr:4053_t:CDS:2 [Scutellospora calospora]
MTFHLQFLVTTNHLSNPLLIGYAVLELVVAPSGLFGICGSISNNILLMNRYARDHWFSFIVLTIIDIVKIILSFTMKDNTINSCVNGSVDPNDRFNCQDIANFNIRAGLVVFGAQEIILAVLGSLVWLCVKRVSQKSKDRKNRIPEKQEIKEIDMEVQESHVANDVASTFSADLLEKRQHMDQDSLIANPPSPFIRRPPLNQRQENQISNEIKQGYNSSQNDLRMKENQVNSNITQSSQGFDQIHTAPTRKPLIRSSTLYARPPIVHGHNTMLPSQLISRDAPEMRSVNGNGMMYPPIPNQTESISGFHQPLDNMSFFRGYKPSDNFPQSRPLPLPPLVNNPEIYQISQSAYKGNSQYKIDRPQSNVPHLSLNHSKSLPSLRSSIIDLQTSQPSSDSVYNNQQFNNNFITMSSNQHETNISQPKTLNTQLKSPEMPNIIQNSDNNVNNDSLKRMRRKSAQSIKGEANPRSNDPSLYNHYNDLLKHNKNAYNKPTSNNDYINNSYVAHSRLSNQVVPYNGVTKPGSNSKNNINKQNFMNGSYTNNSYATRSKLSNQVVVPLGERRK